MVDEFQQKGQFTLSHIQDMTGHQRSNLLSLNQLVDILMHHNILAEVKDEQNPEPKFIMPAVLQYASEEELNPPATNAEQGAPPLVICFGSGFVPFGVFCASTANLIAHQDVMKPKWKLCDKNVRKNKVTFNIRGGYCATFISRPQYIEVQVSKQHENARCTTSIGEACLNVRKIAATTLKTVITQMKYKPYTNSTAISSKRKFEYAFKCCLENHGDHLMKVIKEGGDRFAECCKTECELTLRKEHFFWFSDKVSASIGMGNTRKGGQS